MTPAALKKMSLKQLLDLQAKVADAIQQARLRERELAKQAVADLAAKHGFSMSELYGGKGRAKKASPKYVNPDNPAETWAGRGRKPLWLLEKLKKGAKLESFAI